MHRTIDGAIKINFAPLRDRMSWCERLLKGYFVMLDNLTMRLESQENFKGFSNSLDTMTEEI